MNHVEIMLELRKNIQNQQGISSRRAHVMIVKNETESMSEEQKALHARWREAYDNREADIAISRFDRPEFEQVPPTEWESRTGKYGAE